MRAIQSPTIERIGFYAALATMASGLFWFNRFHEAEQGIFQLNLLAGQNLLNGDGYSLVAGQPAFYPLWGYSLFLAVAGFSPWKILALQGMLCIGAGAAFYRTFGIVPRFWHLPLFVPFVSLLAIKWATGLVAALLLFFIFGLVKHVEEKNPVGLVVAGLAGAIAVALRPEAWLWPCAVALAALLVKETRRGMLILAVTVVAAQAVVMLPWAWRGAVLEGEWLFTSSNVGHVQYVSLGDDPSNPWGLSGKDEAGMEYARSIGIADSLSPQGNAALKKRFRAMIAGNPGAYVHKILYNGWRLIKGGVFAGQLFTMAMTERQYAAFAQSRERGGMLSAFGGLESAEGFWVGAYLALDYLFRVGWVALLALVGWYALRPFSVKPSAAAFILVFTAFTFALAMYAQYQPRHITLVWLPLLGTVMARAGWK